MIWIEGQDCAGNTEGFLRASHPTVAEIILDTLSVNYHETIMAPAGTAAEKSRTDTIAAYPKGYIAVVEGAIPLAENGIYCTVGGRTFQSIVQEVCGNALATIAVGTCAFDGGLPGANGGPTGATGVSQFVPNATVINLPGCPMNVQNLTATIVHYLTFGAFPATDSMGRPLFAYGQLLHDQCERRAHFDAGEYVLAWGDAGPPPGLVPLQDGLQGPRDVRQLPHGPLQRPHQLAGQGGPRLRRLHDAGLLGPDEPVLPTADQPAGVRGGRHAPTRSASAWSAWWPPLHGRSHGAGERSCRPPRSGGAGGAEPARRQPPEAPPGGRR